MLLGSPLPPGVSETGAAHARCPHRACGKVRGQLWCQAPGAEIRSEQRLWSEGHLPEEIPPTTTPHPPKSSHCAEGSRGGGLSCSVCLAASARGFCFVRGEKEAAVGRRVKGGRGGREKKKSHRGQRRLGWPSRAGSEPGRLVAELGKVWESPPRG